jgi:IMP dehydrogenase
MIREGLTFDDVLLVPQHSTVESRSKVDISVKLNSLKFKHPIIPANMKTITGLEMAWEVAKSGGLAILHRFMPIEDQINIAEDIIDNLGDQNLAVSVGVKSEDVSYVSRFLDAGVRIFCIDIAHGDSSQCTAMITAIKGLNPKATVIAGNVATGEGARRLWEAGADVVKVGVGPGSLCTTRIETGNGVPQLTALIDVAKTQEQLNELQRAKSWESSKRKFYVIADGGIKSAGDVVKALCFADMVMVGNLFAGCEETPGEIIRHPDGHTYKSYVGSSTHKTNHIEGVAAMVPTKGRFEDILTKLLEGLRSGCSYQGAHNLEELRDNPEFIRITNAGLKESHPHDVILR